MTGGGVPARLIAGITAGILLAAALWFILWVLAVAVGGVIVLAVPGLIALHRYNRRQAQQFMAAMQARHAVEAEAAAKRQVAASQPTAVTNIYGGTHLYLTPGTPGAEIVRRAVIEGAVIRED